MPKTTLLKITLSRLVLLTALSATVPALACGPEGKGDKARMRQSFDRNGDGTIDDTERVVMKQAMQARWAAHRQALVARYDRNQDGLIDETERAAARKARATARFQSLDTNHDGSLSLAEFEAGAGHRHAAGRRGPGRR